MRFIWATFGLCFAAGCVLAQSAKVVERTIALENFGFKTGSCEVRQGVQFVDDDRLVLSAPLVATCDKSNWNNGIPTQITVIDLHGTVLSAKTRPDIYEVKAGPIGSITICTETSVELFSGNLDAKNVLSTGSSAFDACSSVGGLTPSRTAISVRSSGPAPKSRWRDRLFDSKLEQPIAEYQPGNGDRLIAITDSGYAICNENEHENCVKLTVDGRDWVIGFPPRTFAHDIGLFLSPEELLLPHTHWDKSLVEVSPDGTQKLVINLKSFIPINVDSERIEISATYPRRILYTATGCRIGDFDDCYGLAFNRLVVFDPKTHLALFKRNSGQYSTSIISPNGHVVVTLDKTKLHIYTIP